MESRPNSEKEGYVRSGPELSPAVSHKMDCNMETILEVSTDPENHVQREAKLCPELENTQPGGKLSPGLEGHVQTEPPRLKPLVESTHSSPETNGQPTYSDPKVSTHI